MNEMEEVKDIIEKSGNNFHCKVIKYLSKNGWVAKISPYYNDLISGKPREIDLIAEKFFVINDNYGRRLGRISVRLFIECKSLLSG